MVAQIDIRDPEAYQAYLAGFMPIFEKYGGQLLVTSRSETEVLEGDWNRCRTVVLRFPSLAQARAWYDDPAYRALAAHRHRAAHTNLVLVEGADA